MTKVALFQPPDLEKQSTLLTRIGIRYEVSNGCLYAYGNIVLKDKNFTEMPDLRGVVLDGHFSACDLKLRSLIGAPRIVTEVFSCDDNDLTSLEGAPEKARAFSCMNNKLPNLLHGPAEVADSYACWDNPLTSLAGLAKTKIFGKGHLHCEYKDIFDLRGLSRLRGYKEIELVVGDEFLHCRPAYIFRKLKELPKMQAYLDGRETARRLQRAEAQRKLAQALLCGSAGPKKVTKLKIKQSL